MHIGDKQNCLPYVQRKLTPGPDALFFMRWRIAPRGIFSIGRTMAIA